MKKHIITLLLIAFAQTAFAVQIDSVRVSPANCGNDGSITVYLGGADLPLLENVIYSANGVQSSLNTIPNLAPGTYNVQVSGWIGN
ncbi:MAG: hypothetical protein LBV75_03260, partial [Paludibacter sp.]|nr:hypothetical protein [Paludibacter sp.]